MSVVRNVTLVNPTDARQFIRSTRKLCGHGASVLDVMDLVGRTMEWLLTGETSLGRLGNGAVEVQLERRASISTARWEQVAHPRP